MPVDTLDVPPPAAPEEPVSHHHPPADRAFDPTIIRKAIGASFKKLTPLHMAKSPVLFVVYVGSIWSIILFLRDFSSNSSSQNVFEALVVAFVAFVVLFGNFAEALAEGRGKAQADTLRKARAETVAHVLQSDGSIVDKPSTKLEVGDRCVVTVNEVIPGDGDVIEGLALVDESAITGEAAPVIPECGGDRSAVTGGTKVLSDRIVVQIATAPGETFLDRMISLVEGADRQKTPNEIALQILLVGLTLVFVMAVGTLQPFAVYSGAHQTIIVLVALVVALAPTTIGALLSAIGIAGMDRMIQRNVLAMAGRAVETPRAA